MSNKFNKRILNLKKINNKSKLYCPYCLFLYSIDKVIKCTKCKKYFCKKCISEISYDRKLCPECLIKYIQKDVLIVVEKVKK